MVLGCGIGGSGGSGFLKFGECLKSGTLVSALEFDERVDGALQVAHEGSLLAFRDLDGAGSIALATWKAVGFREHHSGARSRFLGWQRGAVRRV